MKRFLRIFLLSILTALCLTAFAGAEVLSGDCGTYDSSVTWTLDTETDTLTISGTGRMKDWEYQDFNLPWRNHLSGIKTISISDGITSIGSQAFRSCENLRTIYLPASITSIGRSAFNDCPSVSLVYFGGSPEHKESLELDMQQNYGIDYSSCHWAYYVPDTPGEVLTHTPGEEILSGNCGAEGNNVTWTLGTQSHVLILSGSGAMRDYSSGSTPSWLPHKDLIGTVVIADGVTNIGESVFCDLPNLIWAEIPESVTAIGANAFRNCNALLTLNIPSDVTSIGECAFRNCSNLVAVTLPDSLHAISDELFSGCENLSQIALPAGLERIGTESFSGTGLTEIAIPNSVNSISHSAFSGCKSLTGISLPDSVTELGSAVFRRCSSLAEVRLSSSLTTIPSHTFDGCTSLTEITVPEGVITIEDGSFSGDWTIPGFGAFSSCTSLTAVHLPSTLTYIGECTFANCKALTEIRIPDSVTAIGDLCFEYCGALSSIQFPTKLETIGYQAFSRCTRLTEVSLPQSLKTVNTRAFMNTSLDTVYYEGSEQDWSKIDFTSGNEQLTGAYIIYGQDTPSDEPEAPTVSGTVSGGVSGATVEIGGTKVEVNADGSFSLPADGEKFDVVIKTPGALSYTVKNVTAEGGDITLPDIAPVKGDTNGDDMINIMDMAAFRQNFGKTGAAVQNVFTDTNGDGMVNIMDMGTFRMNFGKTAAKDCTVEYSA